MHRFQLLFCTIAISVSICLTSLTVEAQNMPPKYPTLELFTNTPCPICGSQNPGLFTRLAAFDGEYHLISFYPGKPYTSCIFYQANISENTARLNFYQGQVFGTPTVAINGVEFKSSGSVSNSVLENITGGESWLQVKVEETTGGSRTANITLIDHAGGSLSSGRLYAAIVEREILYNAPNGETVHHNVFRKFLSQVNGDIVDLSSGTASKSYPYIVDPAWQADEIYVIAWLKDPETKEIYNSGTKFDPGTSATDDVEKYAALNIYPNPASEEINITLPEEISSATLRIYNTGGQLVSERNTSVEKQVTVNVANWPVGTYQAQIVSDKKAWSGSFRVVGEE